MLDQLTGYGETSEARNISLSLARILTQVNNDHRKIAEKMQWTNGLRLFLVLSYVLYPLLTFKLIS